MLVSLGEVEHSIGYASLPEVLSANLAGTVLTLDGVAPTPQNVEENRYPLTRQIGLVIDPNPSRGVMNFIDFAYRNSAQELMRSHGYSPVLMSLVVATIPERTPIRQEERYRPLVDYLSGMELVAELGQFSSPCSSIIPSAIVPRVHPTRKFYKIFAACL